MGCEVFREVFLMIVPYRSLLRSPAQDSSRRRGYSMLSLSQANATNDWLKSLSVGL
jgi:hypothetical protein